MAEPILDFTVAMADRFIADLSGTPEDAARLQKIWRAMITAPEAWTVAQVAARSKCDPGLVAAYLSCLFAFNKARLHGTPIVIRRRWWQWLNPWQAPEQRYRIDASRHPDAGATVEGVLGRGLGPAIANDAGDPFEADKRG